MSDNNQGDTMRQITDRYSNVLPEPYLTMANKLFDQDYYDRHSLSYPANSLLRCFNWYANNEDGCFWLKVYNGNTPEIPHPEATDTATATDTDTGPHFYDRHSVEIWPISVRVGGRSISFDEWCRDTA